MRIIIIILLLGIAGSCNEKEKIEITVNRLENNILYFSISNNSEDSILFLKPKHNYLCYEGNSKNKSLYNGYYILGLTNTFTDEQSYRVNNSVFSVPLDPSKISTYDKI